MNIHFFKQTEDLEQSNMKMDDYDFCKNLIVDTLSRNNFKFGKQFEVSLFFRLMCCFVF